MNTLYLDCSMGAAGDMLTAALLELLPDRAGFLRRLNGLGLPGVVFRAEPGERCGIRGTHITVTVHGVAEDGGGHDHPHEHPHAHPHDHIHAHSHGHTSLADIARLTEGLPVSEAVRRRILAVYRRIAEAESHAHGVPVEEVHFHEVGAMDAVADVTAVCLLLEALHPDRIVVSPVAVGSGHVRCAHGMLPVPAPATAYLLRGVPVYGGGINGELCTPTGAALLTEFADSFGPLPEMTLEAVGCGLGTKEFPKANCLRALAGTAAPVRDSVTELLCTVDDMTAEDLGHAVERLLEAGALDVHTVAVTMKKGRPGTQLRLLCRPDRAEEMAALLFRHTTTLGVRALDTPRYVLQRWVETVDTPFGPVRRKFSQGYGVRREKWEYEDLARIAREQDLSLPEVRAALDAALPDD